MRLTPEEQQIIVHSIKTIFTGDASIWLFGSRCDDSARGGDIDLYIETPPLDEIVRRKIALKIALEEQLGEQKIDIVVHDRTRPPLPIHEIARSQGIRLRTTS
jgi:predicted nucleotidyltransferase